MNKYSFRVKMPAYKTVTVEAPDPKSALDWAEGNLSFGYAYGLQDGWEIDDMEAEMDVHTDKNGVIHGVDVLDDDEHCEYQVTPEWLKEQGYVATYTKTEETA